MKCPDLSKPRPMGTGRNESPESGRQWVITQRSTHCPHDAEGAEDVCTLISTSYWRRRHTVVCAVSVGLRLCVAKGELDDGQGLAAHKQQSILEVNLLGGLSSTGSCTNSTHLSHAAYRSSLQDFCFLDVSYLPSGKLEVLEQHF